MTDKTLLIAGLGNIGSSLPALLLQAGARRLILLDRDHVEAKNLAVQDYSPADVGRPKAEALAERLYLRFPDREIHPLVADLEDLREPPIEADLMLGALDSRRARQVLVGDLAWPRQIPVLDAGVGDAGKGRVQVFVPGSACLECTWGTADYRLISAEYPCRPGARAEGAPTGAPGWLGAFTAALLASEACKILQRPQVQDSYEIAFDLEAGVMRRFQLRRNPRCRYPHLVSMEQAS